MTRLGAIVSYDRREWDSRSGVRRRNRQTFVHKDCQRQPSTQGDCRVTAASTTGYDAQQR
jgi:hypothetical protein